MLSNFLAAASDFPPEFDAAPEGYARLENIPGHDRARSSDHR